MARKQIVKNAAKSNAGEQQPLIDVEPENSKVILRHARAVLSAKEVCGKANQTVKNKKTALREAIKEAGLKPLADGTIRVRVGDVIVTSSPQDEKISIKSVGEDAGGDDEEGDE